MSRRKRRKLQDIMRNILKQKGTGCYGSETERASGKRGSGKSKSDSKRLRATLEDMTVF